MKTTTQATETVSTPIEAPVKKTFTETMLDGTTAKTVPGERIIYVGDEGKKLEVIAGGKIRNMGMLQAGWWFKLSGGDKGQVISVDETKAVVKMSYGVTSISPRSEVEILDPEKVDVKETKSENSTAEETIEEKESKKKDTYEFNGKSLSKGHLVREIIAKFVQDNPKTTLKQLDEKFPAPFMGKFGLFKKLDEAKQISGTGTDRYFFKEEHLITVGKDKIAVCNQMTSEKLEKIVELAKTAGVDIL